MITGLFLKNFKIYKKTHFVPISADHKLSAFVGANGAGKSSVLEALDTYFNNAQWIINKVARQAGETTNFINYPYICPVFVLPKDKFKTAHRESGAKCPMEIINKISEFLWTAQAGQIKASRESYGAFIEHRDKLAERFAQKDHYLLALGVRFSPSKSISPTHFGPFHAQASFIAALGLTPAEDGKQIEKAKRNDTQIGNLVGDINATTRNIYDYVYIPSDVNVAEITRLESGTMQTLMRRNIDTEIRSAIDRPTLRKINESLEQTVATAVSGLPEYTYDKPIGGKKSITHPSLCKLITREFFAIRELSRVHGSGPATPISHLSSGEQRRALIDVATNYLKIGSQQHQYTILAIDEPEISLHTSRCFDQFEDLFDVARRNIQTIMTTHWYGFLPIAQKGNAHFLDPSDDGRVQIDSYDLHNYREAAKHRTAASRGALPFDLALKSANDLVQSIASSLRLLDSYSWILCEGSSETVYFDYMLEDRLKNGHLRILALGGAPEVKRIYHHLEVALSDKTLKTEGRVFALIDTDEQIVSHEQDTSVKALAFCRLLLPRSGPLQLVPVGSKIVSPATAIEDVLNPDCFVATLRTFSDRFNFSIDPTIIAEATASGRALDLKDSQKMEISSFFAETGMKLEFAKQYVRIARTGDYAEPLVPLIEMHLT